MSLFDRITRLVGLGRQRQHAAIQSEDTFHTPAEIMLQIDQAGTLREIPAVWRLPGPPDQIARTSEGDYWCAPDAHPAVLGWRQLRPDEYHLTVCLRISEVNLSDADHDEDQAPC